MKHYSTIARKALIASALLLQSLTAHALISVMEALPSTKDAIYVGTTTPQVLLNGGTYYAGLVPSVSLYVASNTVLGNCVAYSTGSIMCLGVKLSTGDPVGAYVPYTGATSNVNLGAKTLTTTGNIQVGQVGAGTSASTNFMYDGLSPAGAGYVRIGAGANQATGYYWGGTRGYSMQQRYDLTGTPFTLHDELNNVDRFYLDTSGEWYFPVGVTVDSFTSLGSIKGAGTGLTGTGSSFTAGKATALAAAGTSAPSGQLSRGVDASGNNLNASVDATETSGSTNPYQSGGAFTALALKAPIASPTFTGTVGGAAGVFTGTFTAGGFATNGSINASSGTFTATGDGQYGVLASSGIKAAAGDICTASVCLNSVSSGGGGGGGGSGVVFSSSGTFSAQTVITINLPSNSAGYCVCQSSYVQNTSAGFLNFRLNSDSGSNYKWGWLVQNPVNSAGTGSNAGTFIPGTRSDSSVAVAQVVLPDVTVRWNGKIGALYIRSDAFDGTNFQSFNGTGQYSGASNVGTFTFEVSAGTISGAYFLYCSGI